MRGTTHLILFAGLLGFSSAQEIREEPVLNPDSDPKPMRPAAASEEAKGEPWLGISISKPTPAIYAQLSKVPKGVGFIVDTVEPAGPAMGAGVERYDLLWKFDDQLLINEGQFLSLLAMKEDGDRVALTCFRGGENLEFELVMRRKVRPVRATPDIEHVLSAGRIPGLPWQTVDVRERIAMVEDSEGVVKVSRRGEAYVWEELSLEGALKSRGALRREGSEGALIFPDETAPKLQRKLSALVRAYEQAASRQRGETRLPRVRRVPTPE